MSLEVPALTENASLDAVVAGNVYWGLAPEGEGEHLDDVGERLGEGSCGTSREMMVGSLRIGGLWGARSL